MADSEAQIGIATVVLKSTRHMRDPEMKVLVWTGGHTIAASLFENPPDGYEAVSNVQRYSRRTGISGERMFVIPSEAKTILDNIAYGFGIPRPLPSLAEVDLIHTVSGLTPIVPKPWVTSISMPSSFFGLKDDWYESRRRMWILRKILQSRYCRRVTTFSDSTLKGFLNILGREGCEPLSEKLEVMYPAIDAEKSVPKRAKGEGRFRILFVGNHFFDKGGRELHRAVGRLSKKYDVQLDLVTNAPRHHQAALKDYMAKHQEDFVKWHVPGLSRRTLMEEMYPDSDVFVMCSYMEVFGFVFLEAMASGLPIIGANVYAQREIVVEDKNGYLIDVPVSPFEGEPQLRTIGSVERYRRRILDASVFDSVVDQLTNRLTNLIEDSSITSRMSRESLRMTKEGRFSVSARNAQLKRIYAEALE